MPLIARVEERRRDLQNGFHIPVPFFSVKLHKVSSIVGCYEPVSKSSKQRQVHAKLRKGRLSQIALPFGDFGFKLPSLQ